jgi:putative ABC transport system permease protein
MALGAQENDVLRLVLLHGTMLVAIGVVIGIGSALWLTRLIGSLLFGIPANDLNTHVAGPIGPALVAFIACYISARRATRVEPIVVLRCD